MAATQLLWGWKSRVRIGFCAAARGPRVQQVSCGPGKLAAHPGGTVQPGCVSGQPGCCGHTWAGGRAGPGSTVHRASTTSERRRSGAVNLGPRGLGRGGHPRAGGFQSSTLTSPAISVRRGPAARSPGVGLAEGWAPAACCRPQVTSRGGLRREALQGSPPGAISPSSVSRCRS